MAERKWKLAYRFRVSLQGTKPPIWRRIEVPDDYTFWDLHVAIQDAMGWKDMHLHKFLIEVPLVDDSIEIGIPMGDDSEDEDGMQPGWELPICLFFNPLVDTAEYTYDFGDDWRHRVKLESIAPREAGVAYPRCLSGRRACPPEDCGGVSNFEAMLKILQDGTHPDHEDVREWLGGPFDAGAFDPAAVSFDDPEERWKRLLHA